jgi:hypothetical protein
VVEHRQRFRWEAAFGLLQRFDERFQIIGLEGDPYEVGL